MAKLTNELKSELELLDKERLINSKISENKKISFIEEIKSGSGKEIIEKINNPNRHNPKKMSIFGKIMKALGC